MDRAGSSFSGSRVHGITDQANAMGAFFVAYMFLLLAPFLVRPGHRPHAVWLLAFLVCLRGITATFSRGAFVGFGVGSLVICWLRHKGLFIAAAALGLVLLVNPAWLPEGVRDRLESSVTERPHAQATDDLAEQLDSSAGNRLYMWAAARRMIIERPIWGAGFGMAPRLMPHYTQGAVDHLDAHNVYLNIAVEMGLPAAGAFLVVLGLAGAAAYRLARQGREAWSIALGMGLVAGLAGLMAANLFTTGTLREEAVAYLWILTALTIRVSSLERTGSQAGAV
jgi:putative inorganic carbon (HCO3(-)) transporter